MIRRLINRVSKLLDLWDSIEPNDYQQRCQVVKQDALDELNRRGFSRNPIYGDIQAIQFHTVHRLSSEDVPELRKLVFCYHSSGLRWLKNRLEFAKQLVRQKRRKASRPAAPNLPPQDAGSRARAKTVSLLYDALLRFGPPSDDGKDWQRLQKQNPSLAQALEIGPQHRLHASLQEAHGARKKLRLSIALAGHYHTKELSTIQTDWKDYKPQKYRRK